MRSARADGSNLAKRPFAEDKNFLLRSALAADLRAAMMATKEVQTQTYDCLEAAPPPGRQPRQGCKPKSAAGAKCMNTEQQSCTFQSSVLEPFLEAEEAASFVKYSPRHLKQLAREGKVPAHPRGDGQRRRWLFLLSELDAWMRGRVNSTCDPCRVARSIQ